MERSRRKGWATRGGTDDDHGRGHGRFTEGAPGVGDRCYPFAGNGGYDVQHNDITGRHDPLSNVWTATTVISARATQNRSRFDLDFDGMTVRRLEVNGDRGRWVRDGAELVVMPKVHGDRRRGAGAGSPTSPPDGSR